MNRIAAGISILGTILVLPWWIAAVAAATATAFFPFYGELLLFGIIMDTLYGPLSPSFYRFPFSFTAGTVIVLIAAAMLRRFTSFGEKGIFKRWFQP